MSESTQNAIHNAVQERYSRLAKQSQDCCGDECGCSSDRLYDISLSDVPQEVAEFSLGCGDPISIAELRPGEVVVDLGSGGGLDAFLAARRVGESGHVVGIDMTPAMIERATHSRDRQGLTNVEFRLGKIEAMPLPDNFADVIISNCVINLAPDKAAVFRDAFRVLKPGGRFAVADIVSEGDLNEDEQSNMDAWAECMTGAIDVDRYLNLLRDVGFVDVGVTHKVEANVEAYTHRIWSARITAYKPN
jgi:SAM-dependent methyltransferase